MEPVMIRHGEPTEKRCYFSYISEDGGNGLKGMIENRWFHAAFLPDEKYRAWRCWQLEQGVGHAKGGAFPQILCLDGRSSYWCMWKYGENALISRPFLVKWQITSLWQYLETEKADLSQSSHKWSDCIYPWWEESKEGIWITNIFGKSVQNWWKTASSKIPGRMDERYGLKL